MSTNLIRSRAMRRIAQKTYTRSSKAGSIDAAAEKHLACCIVFGVSGDGLCLARSNFSHWNTSCATKLVSRAAGGLPVRSEWLRKPPLLSGHGGIMMHACQTRFTIQLTSLSRFHVSDHGILYGPIHVCNGPILLNAIMAYATPGFQTCLVYAVTSAALVRCVCNMALPSMLFVGPDISERGKTNQSCMRQKHACIAACAKATTCRCHSHMSPSMQTSNKKRSISWTAWYIIYSMAPRS